MEHRNAMVEDREPGNFSEIKIYNNGSCRS